MTPPVINLKQKELEINESEEVRFQVYTERHFEKIDALKNLSEELRFEMRVVANVLPFRVNQYVIDELIDWNNVPEDPMFQLTFPQKGMLADSDFDQMAATLRGDADKKEITRVANEIRQRLNPHPAGQQLLNVPKLDDETLEGVQHKYRETVLFFPSQGQVCHSYCTFCFRWAQFIGDKELRFSAKEADHLHQYLATHKNINDLLVTGGDPMVMKTSHLVKYLEPLLDSKFDHIQTIRIGTKSLTFWPHRYVTDKDADELIALLSKLVKAGKHVALMAHFNHWHEMDTPMVKRAIQRIKEAGVTIRTQAPLLNNINNNADMWAKMWRMQVKLGLIPYYMFIERDTGAKCYFEIPLERAWQVYRDAMKQVSGLARTARGPSMSAGPGKVEVQGITEIKGEKVFVLRFIQARNPDWVQQPFFAKFDAKATWLDQLKPAFGEEKFFYEEEYEQMCAGKINPRTV